MKLLEGQPAEYKMDKNLMRTIHKVVTKFLVGIVIDRVAGRWCIW